MKKLLLLCVTLLLVLAFSESSFALSITMGSGSYIDTSGSNSVLQIQADINTSLAGNTFKLDEEGSTTFRFAKIYTTESWINYDDINPGTVKAYLDFASPKVLGTVDGTSIGFSGCWSFNQGWKLTWKDPVQVAFDGGTLSIDLEDAYYNGGWWSGPDGSDYISAKITLASTNSVSEPANMLLMGTALIGLAGLSRKKIFKK